MERNCIGVRPSFLILVLTLTCVSAIAQTIPNPLLVLQDSASDGATLPLLSVQGGASSSTQGIQVTSLTTGTGGGLTTFQPAGYGGITLLQTGAATSTAVQGSPIFSMCGQQYTGSGTSTPACWNWQVTGTAGLNAQDILSLFRTTSNSTSNITFQVPDALNIAAGSFTGTTGHGGQLTIGSLPSGDIDLSKKYVTLVGGFTSSSDTGAKANPLQIFPGWLSSPSTNAGALEGPLQIGMMVKGMGSSSNYNLLACYTSAQTGTPCGNLSNPLTAPLLGVYSPLGCPPVGSPCSTGGSAAIVAPPGRALVAQSSPTGTTWAAGTAVCRDTTNGSRAIASTTGSCPIGQAVGVAVGDSGSTTTHLVDLDFAPQGTTSSGNATTYATANASLGSAAAGNLLASDGSGNLGSSGVSDGFTTTPYVAQVVAVDNATGQTGSIGNTQIASGAQGQYSLTVYLNLTAVCTNASGGSLAPKVIYTDSNGSVTKSFATINALGSLPANNTATVSLWSVASPGTISVAVTYTACTTGSPTYDVHFALTKLQ